VRSAGLLLLAWAAAAPASAKEDWKLGLNVSETWDTNVRFANPPGGRFATRVSAQLGRVIQGPRWQLGLNGSAMKSFFHGSTSPRAQGIFFGVGATFGLQLSDRASLTVADRFRSAYTGEAIDFVDVDEDVILPQAGQRRNHLTGGLSFQISSLHTISLNVVWDKALFQQEEVFQPRLRNGERFASGLHLSRKLNDLNTINLGYTYARSAHALSPADIHSVSLGFSRKLGEFTNAGIAIGASHRASFDGDLNAISGGLAISRALENSSFTLGYGRNLGPVFGLGRDLLHDTVRVSYRRQLSRSVYASTGGHFARNRDPLDAGFSYNAWSAGAGVGVNVFQNFNLHGGYNYFKRTPLPGELGRRFEAHRAAIQLGWNTSF
jgi:hypothetical protein